MPIINMIKVELKLDWQVSPVLLGEVYMRIKARPDRPCYILTHDLGDRIESLRCLGLSTPDYDDDFYQIFRSGLERRVQSFHPNAELKNLSVRGLSEKMWAEAVRRQSVAGNAVIVSSVNDVSSPSRGYILEINRIYNFRGVHIGFGPRPSNFSLNEQIQAFSRVALEHSVILLEDGAGSGKTVIYILELLKAKRLHLSTIILGFSSKKGIEAIRGVFNGEIVTIEGVFEVIDWMPDHDFIPFAPNCGRVFGVKFGSEACPIYTHDGLAFAVPYIRPFGDPNAWATIPENEVGEFSHYCLRQSLALFVRIEEMNGNKHLRIRDIMGVHSGGRIPTSIYSESFPHPNTRVTDYLKSFSHLVL